MRLYSISFTIFCLLLCSAAVAQSTVTAPFPFFDDFANTPNGCANPRFWSQSSVSTNGNYTATQHTLQVATFDALDASGKIYPQARGGGAFAADTLCSQPIDIPYAAQNVYLTFRFMPGGLGDMPEQEDSLLLYFFEPSAAKWHLAWAASTNATLSSGCDTIMQHHLLLDSTVCYYDSCVRVPFVTKTFFNGRDFTTTMVEVPYNYCSAGFRFMFVNMASRAGSEISGMLSNCDLWHLDYVYLNQDRSPTQPAFREMSWQRPPASFLKEYTAMPWRHLKDNSRAINEQVLHGDGSIHLVYYLYNMSDMPSSYNGDLNLRLLKGGSWNKVEDNLLTGSGSIEATTILQLGRYDSVLNYYYPRLTTEMFDMADADADSVAVEMRAVLRRYSTETGVDAQLLRNNDTNVFVQKFYDYYAYDDGTAENGYGIYGENAANTEFAVKFHSYRADTITGVYIYFNNNIADSGYWQAFTLMLRRNNGGVPGEALYSKRGEQAVYTGLNEFIYYPLDKGIILQEGDFFVGIRMQTAEMLNIGVDVNNYRTGKTFVRIATAWQPSQVDNIGSLMIRPSFARTGVAVETYVPQRPQSIALTIYPNPASSEAHILLPDDIDVNDLHINILDVMGRAVRSIPFVASIDISALPEGIYILQIQTSIGETLAAGKVAVVNAK